MAGSPLSAPRELRARWYLQTDKYHKSVKEVCGIFGISRKTYYKWYNLDHYLVKRTNKPRCFHPQTKLTPDLKVIVIKTKLKYNYGPRKMATFLKRDYGIKVAPNAIYKFYKKKHLIRKPLKKLAWYCPMLRPYYATIPGENVQLDVKYVPGKDLGWSYQYRFIDTVTNLQYSVEMAVKDAQATIQAFRLARKSFPFEIRGIQTDNGSEFRGDFNVYLNIQNIIHRFIPKRSAPWNGKVERANRSIDDEYYLNPTRPWNTLGEYVHWYNHERPHLGKNMNGLTPYQKYLSLASKKCHP